MIDYESDEEEKGDHQSEQSEVGMSFDNAVCYNNEEAKSQNNIIGKASRNGGVKVKSS